MNQAIRTKLSKNVKNLRIQKKLKREELSLILGFDNSYISKLENERINITLDRLKKIADYFKIEAYKLLK